MFCSLCSVAVLCTLGLPETRGESLPQTLEESLKNSGWISHFVIRFNLIPTIDHYDLTNVQNLPGFRDMKLIISNIFCRFTLLLMLLLLLLLLLLSLSLYYYYYYYYYYYHDHYCCCRYRYRYHYHHHHHHHHCYYHYFLCVIWTCIFIILGACARCFVAWETKAAKELRRNVFVTGWNWRQHTKLLNDDVMIWIISPV